MRIAYIIFVILAAKKAEGDMRQLKSESFAPAWPDEAANSPAELAAETLTKQAADLAAQEDVLLNAAAVAETYNAALAEVMDEKAHQVTEIEDRLEDLIATQASRIEQMEAQQPGLFSVPGSRKKWQQPVAACQATMQRLHARMELIRDIKDGTQVHIRRLEQLAVQKLARRESELNPATN
jgi:hypothetical protein